MKNSLLLLFVVVCLLISCQEQERKFAITVSFDKMVNEQPIDGRILLMLSSNDEKEPRFQINSGLNAQPVFGMDVNGMVPGQEIVFDESIFGFPYESLAELQAGEYTIQALLHVYETFDLITGHTVKLPMDNGEGQQWNRSPGNLYSQPFKITIGDNGIQNVNIVMNQIVPPIEEPADTKWVKHIKLKSEKLSEFWGRDMYLGAHVLLPKGFDEHPEAKYPLMIFHGHFPSDFGGFRTTPPDPNMEPDYAARFDVKGYNIIQQQEAYDFYKRWNEPDFPRFLIVEIQHPTPYYDDSYAVNSASQGPYGDAITYELIPHIEEQFRGRGEGWARFLYGGSTGGWEALAVQVKYPEEYNGCFAACPDPIDFRAYCLTNIY
ncbi:MAG: alpha/beta hydrolase-fold protein, partial [Croceivirga sp.]